MADQAAGSGGGQAAGQRFVQFSRQAAQRIAKAVRHVEQGNREQPGISLVPRSQQAPSKTFRIATFTGQWDIDAVKTVTFKYQTNTPNTAAAINLFSALGTSVSDPRPCAIAREGTGWYLVAALCEAE